MDISRKKHLLLTISVLMILLFIVCIQTAEARGLPGAVLSFGDGKDKDPLFKTGDTVSFVPLKTKGANQIFWIDSYNRILRLFPYEEEAEKPEDKGKKKKGPVGAKKISFTIDCPVTPVTYIIIADKNGKPRAKTPVKVKAETAPWDDFAVWLHGGYIPRGAEYDHYRACYLNPVLGTADRRSVSLASSTNTYAHGNQNLGFHLNFGDNSWPRFMSPHRMGKLNEIKKGLQRNPCLNDPAFLKKTLSLVEKDLAKYGKILPAAYSLKENPSVNLFADPFDYDFSPKALEAFREWCKKKYGTIKALNKQWESDFKTWEEVEPDTTNQARMKNNPLYKKLLTSIVAGIMMPERSIMPHEYPDPAKQNYSSWSDHREFMDDTFRDVLKACADKAHELRPDIKCGFLGAQMPSAFGGHDYWNIMQAVDWVEPCGMGSSWDMFTSWGRTGTRFVKSISVRRPDIQRYVITSSFLKGGHGVVLSTPRDLWRGKAPRTPVLAALRTTFRELTSGIGKLRFLTEHKRHPVGIYFNQSSQRASWLSDAVPDGTSWPRRLTFHAQSRSSVFRALTGMILAVEDNGYQARVVAKEEALQGKLTNKDCKVLFLPRIVSMSIEEAKALEKWVKGGGILVTDGALGSMDSQCKRLKKGSLDSLAGVKRAGFRLCDIDGGYFYFTNSMTASAQKMDKTGKKLVQDVDVSLLLVHSPDLRKSKGKVLAHAGETPALIINKQGRGMVICANIYWADYIKKREQGAFGAPVRSLAANILAIAGLSPHYDVLNRSGKKPDKKAPRAERIDQYFFEDGNLCYAAFNRQVRTAEFPSETRSVSEIYPATWPTPPTISGRLAVYGAEPGELIPLSVMFRSKYHVYNARTGNYHGRTDIVSAELDPLGYVWLSLLPYKVKKIEVKAEQAGGDDPLLVQYTANISVSKGKPGRHVLHLDVVDPEGNICDFLSMNISTENGEVKGMVRIPVNGKTGKWSLLFRDAATGQTGKAVYEKKEKALFAETLPLSMPVQHGKLLGAFGKPVSMKVKDGRNCAEVPVRIWHEGLQDSKGSIQIKAGKPWKCEKEKFDLYEITQKYQGEFPVTLSCAGDTPSEKLDLILTAEVTASDGRSLKLESKYEGKKLGDMLKKNPRISMQFKPYHPDKSSLEIKDGRCLLSVPIRVTTEEKEVPDGEIEISVTEGWTVTPDKIGLKEALISGGGQRALAVSGPVNFKQEPVVYAKLKGGDGVTQEVSRHIAVHYAFKTDKAPVLDGKLDDPAWKEARTAVHSHPGGSAEEAKAFPMSFRTCYDNKNLYVAVEVKGLDPQILVVNPPIEDGWDAAIWADEHVEIFADPTQMAGELPYQMTMNFAGRKYDTAGEDLSQWGGPAWDGNWDMKGVATKEGYIVEVAIPFKELGTGTPKQHDIWAFNVSRTTTEPYINTYDDYRGSWSVHGGKRLSSYLFGRLFFVEKK